MNWDDVWQIVLVCLAAVGGIGGIVLVVVKLSSKMIADRVAKKYGLSPRELPENDGVAPDGGKGISKAVFDKEFEIYQSMLTITADIGQTAQLLKPGGDADKSEDLIGKASGKCEELRRLLARSAPLIPQKNEELFGELCDAYHAFINDRSEENYNNTVAKSDRLRSELRKYLEDLSVGE